MSHKQSAVAVKIKLLYPAAQKKWKPNYDINSVVNPT